MQPLPVLSKILEKYVAILYRYLNCLRENNLSYELQSGFQTRQSSELIRKTDEIVGLALIDFLIAFDVIYYELLLKELSIIVPATTASSRFNNVYIKALTI